MHILNGFGTHWVKHENNHRRNIFQISLFYTNVKSPGNGSVTRINTEQTYTEWKQCSGLVVVSTGYPFQYTEPWVRENSQSQQPNYTPRRGTWGATDHNTSGHSHRNSKYRNSTLSLSHAYYCNTNVIFYFVPLSALYEQNWTFSCFFVPE